MEEKFKNLTQKELKLKISVLEKGLNDFSAGKSAFKEGEILEGMRKAVKIMKAEFNARQKEEIEKIQIQAKKIIKRPFGELALQLNNLVSQNQNNFDETLLGRIKKIFNALEKKHKYKGQISIYNNDTTICVAISKEGLKVEGEYDYDTDCDVLIDWNGGVDGVYEDEEEYNEIDENGLITTEYKIEMAEFVIRKLLSAEYDDFVEEDGWSNITIEISNKVK